MDPLPGAKPTISAAGPRAGPPTRPTSSWCAVSTTTRCTTPTGPCGYAPTGTPSSSPRRTPPPRTAPDATTTTPSIGDGEPHHANHAQPGPPAPDGPTSMLVPMRSPDGRAVGGATGGQ